MKKLLSLIILLCCISICGCSSQEQKKENIKESISVVLDGFYAREDESHDSVMQNSFVINGIKTLVDDEEFTEFQRYLKICIRRFNKLVVIKEKNYFIVFTKTYYK